MIRPALMLLVLATSTPGFADTTVYVVRHTEKAKDPGDGDPVLSESGRARARALARVLRSLELAAIYTTRYKRNRQTVAPVAKAKGLTPKIYKARATAELAAQIRRANRDARVLVAGHSNTVPAILSAFGVKPAIQLADHHYDNLFIVIVPTEGPARLEHLHFGAVDPR